MLHRTYYRNRILFIAAIIAAIVIFNVGGRWFNVPMFEKFNASLLRERSPVSTMVVVALMTWVATIVCTLITGSVRTDAGVCTAAFGLIVLSARGGPMRYALFGASPSVFLSLALEVLLLFGIFFIANEIARFMSRMGLATQADEDFFPDDTPFDQRLIAVAMHMCATATLLLILCRTDAKKQCLVSVGVASFLASLLSGTVAPTRPAIWYWIGPMFVALIGYAWAYFSPVNLAIGQPAGFFEPLSRPLPLDYAGAGIGGAMTGYWMARAWQRQHQHAEEADNAGGDVPVDPSAAQSV